MYTFKGSNIIYNRGNNEKSVARIWAKLYDYRADLAVTAGFPQKSVQSPASAFPIHSMDVCHPPIRIMGRFFCLAMLNIPVEENMYMLELWL